MALYKCIIIIIIIIQQCYMRTMCDVYSYTPIIHGRLVDAKRLFGLRSNLEHDNITRCNSSY